jgi:UDP-N-acetylmuramate--alanine ligase
MLSKKLSSPFLNMGHVKLIHFIGIGGIGMAGIAEVLIHQGYKISGSDLQANYFTKRLTQLGANITIGHNAANLSNADVVVRSTAVPDSNIEVITAQQENIPLIPRAEMLGELMRFSHGIAIAGTHGKTTTTSLVAAILDTAKLDPTFIVGGCLKQLSISAKLGKGNYLVAEADESDASFLYLNPMIAVITNIDADHMATYQHDFATLEQTFLQFLRRLPFYGLAVLCYDDPVINKLLPQVPRFFTTYGRNNAADFYATDISYQAQHVNFTVHRPERTPLAITLNLPGEHNVLNSLAAIAIATKLNIADSIIAQALAQFSGVERRFQVSPNINIPNGGTITLIDDYGHHPREIQVTLAAIKRCWPGQRIVMVYQPHRYSRTRDLFNDFCQILSTVDVLLLLDVYAASEAPIAGATSADLISKINESSKMSAVLVADKTALPKLLQQMLQNHDILLLQGAGDIGTIAANFATNKLLALA